MRSRKGSEVTAAGGHPPSHGTAHPSRFNRPVGPIDRQHAGVALPNDVPARAQAAGHESPCRSSFRGLSDRVERLVDSRNREEGPHGVDQTPYQVGAVDAFGGAIYCPASGTAQPREVSLVAFGIHNSAVCGQPRTSPKLIRRCRHLCSLSLARFEGGSERARYHEGPPGRLSRGDVPGTAI